MFPEFTKKGHLHYHGIVWDCTQYTFLELIKWWRREFGYAKSELKINNLDKWSKYIIKDYNISGLHTIYRTKIE